MNILTDPLGALQRIISLLLSFLKLSMLLKSHVKMSKLISSLSHEQETNITHIHYEIIIVLSETIPYEPLFYRMGKLIDSVYMSEEKRVRGRVSTEGFIVESIRTINCYCTRQQFQGHITSILDDAKITAAKYREHSLFVYVKRTNGKPTLFFPLQYIQD